ncbi:Reverse transcriptase [Phytophthora palmivora]|uniref:Reverse transcriptase n=1 Tax=Phytophthora palmivora TaxID=4796 RepID=A0A2P4Y0W1_9STRA|nr:Reverse transcriptase [Phytophthora palmivora]
MTLTNDLLEDLDKVLWYCSLDMASGFWVVTMTDRVRAISAFITTFGLFEWNRMPFGLKNAPQIYQRLIDNALYGFTRIPPLRSDPRSTDVFEVGEADDPDKPSVIGRRSYIDDILIPADSWDHLGDRVDTLLEACNKWNMPISVVKSFWGMSKEEYLDHRVSKDGLEANPKDLNALTDLEFPGPLRPMQSFQGSLNYYSRFIEDYAIYAAVLYELREVDFAAMSKDDVRIQIKRSVEHKESDQIDRKEDPGSDLTLKSTETYDPEERDGDRVNPRWIRAHRAFETLKSKVASTPTLRHFDADREAVVIVYASDWAISAALEHFQIVKCVKGEEEILGVIAASITPRSMANEALIQISPKKEPRRKMKTPIPVIRADEELGEIDCKAPGLTLFKQRVLDRLKDWPDHELVHVKRDWNSSVDSLASAALQRQGGVKIESDEDKQDLITLSRLGEVLVCKKADQAAQITAVVTRSGSRSTIRTTSDPQSLREEVVRDLRIDRIRQTQDEEAWISGLKKYLNGDLQDLTQQEAKSYANLAADYDLDHHNLMFYCILRDRRMQIEVS